MWALAENHTDVARTLIESGADVDAATTGGFTPLLFTARGGQCNCGGNAARRWRRCKHKG